MELARAVDQYLRNVEAAGYSPNTLKAYATRLNDFARAAGEGAELPVAAADIQAYLGGLRSRTIGRRVGVSDATLAHSFAILSGFFRYCERMLGFEPSPMRDVLRPRGQTSVDEEFKSLSLEELDQLLEVARDGAPDGVADLRSAARRAEDYLLLSLMALAGLRVSEVCNINQSDIHVDLLTVLGKGRKRRTVPLGDEVLTALEAYVPPKPGPHLFGSIRNPGVRLKPASLEQRVPRLAQLAGIHSPRVTPHVLRHTFGSLMLAADPTALIPTRDLMGHESVETTNKYAHTREADRRLALSSMAELRRRPR